jgi:hypothetical protein
MIINKMAYDNETERVQFGKAQYCDKNLNYGVPILRK